MVIPNGRFWTRDECIWPVQVTYRACGGRAHAGSFPLYLITRLAEESGGA